MTFKEHLLQYAKRELAITAFDQTELGGTVLKFLEQSADLTGNNTDSMQQLVTMLSLLIDQQPISFITETDFCNEPYTATDQLVPVKRCIRYPHIYQMSDGKYYDDRAVAFRFSDSHQSDKIYMYGAGNSSKKEITLPYYPNEELVILPGDYSNTSNTNHNINYNSPEPDYEVE